MKKTFTKLTLTTLIVCGFGTAFTTAAFGDVMTGDALTVQQYADLNSSYDTFQVAPGNDPNPLSPHELFNFAAEQYAGSSGAATYNNAADFYADRAVKSLVSDWTVSEDSQIVGMYRSTGGYHHLGLTNSTGTTWNIIDRPWEQFDSQETWIDSLDSSRNIDVGAIGDAVNMNLLASSKSSTIYGDQPELNGGVINMIAYDVTDLIKAMGYAEIENAFMFTWEDISWATETGKARMDFDYNDLVFIMTNVTPNVISATPEPATMLIIGLGLAGLGLARRRRKKEVSQMRLATQMS
ncbi:hypothetical protein FACS189454_07610 [Planctomycetales bacterium]|nr:hypothetical protein FACS189454_07610 [Planctomycetales bacterium]